MAAGEEGGIWGGRRWRRRRKEEALSGVAAVEAAGWWGGIHGYLKVVLPAWYMGLQMRIGKENGSKEFL